VLENELQYHGPAVCINMGDDGATSSKNLVNFCLVTPDIAGLICVPMSLLFCAIVFHIGLHLYFPPFLCFVVFFSIIWLTNKQGAADVNSPSNLLL